MGKKCLKYTNEFRKSEGKKKLEWSDEMHAVGLVHSEYMAEKE